MHSSRQEAALPLTAPEFGDDLFGAWATTTLIVIFIVQDRVFAWVNDHMQRDLGYGAGDLLGRRPAEIVQPDDRSLVRTQAKGRGRACAVLADTAPAVLPRSHIAGNVGHRELRGPLARLPQPPRAARHSRASRRIIHSD